MWRSVLARWLSLTVWSVLALLLLPTRWSMPALWLLPTVWSLLTMDMFLDQQRNVRLSQAVTANLFVRRALFDSHSGLHAGGSHSHAATFAPCDRRRVRGPSSSGLCNAASSARARRGARGTGLAWPRGNDDVDDVRRLT